MTDLSSKIRNVPEDDNGGPVENVASSPTMLVIGIVADVSAVVLLLFTEGFQSWLASNTQVVTISLGALLLIAITAVNRYYALRKSTRTLRGRVQSSDLAAQRAQQESIRLASVEGDLRTEVATLRQANRDLEDRLASPSDKDIERFGAFLSKYGPDSALIKFVRSEYMVDNITSQQDTYMDHATDDWNQDPTTYRDAELAASFELVKETFFAWRRKKSQYFFPRNTPGMYGIPPEWPVNQYQEATDELFRTSTDFVDQYDAFMRLAGRKNLI